MRVFSYRIARDFGFAPNPFGGICTLATCKPHIRSAAGIGDLILGCGSVQRGQEGLAIFAMRVGGAMPFDEYWSDPRFEQKKPFFKGSRRRAFGDNIYHHGPTGGWIQERSHHSFSDGALNEANLDRDTSVDRMLWGVDFVYWGRDAVHIPDSLRFEGEDDVYPPGRGHRANFNLSLVERVDDWFRSQAARGLRGRPLDW